MASTPARQTVRIAPLALSDRSELQRRLLEPVLGDRAANVFTTLAINPSLFEAWTPLCLYLLESPEFTPRERELVILRTAWLNGTSYEWAHHVKFALSAGLTRDEIDSLAANSDKWSESEQVLLRAVDELHGQHTITAGTWTQLSTFLSTTQLIALPMLVGQYTMLASALNAFGVELDEEVAQTPIDWSQK